MSSDQNLLTRGVPMRRHAYARGFTLLEMMLVVAIIGVLAAMTAAASTRIAARNATQSAAAEVSAMLQFARSRAEMQGSDVYVMVFPTMKKDGTTTGGSGALFVYEDMNGDFMSGSGACNGTGTADCSWTNFSPPNNINSPSTSKDKLLKSLYLDDYAKKNVEFGTGTATSAVLKAPFDGITFTDLQDGCSFCNTKGALVFTGEEQLRFFADNGTQASSRTAALALQAVDRPSNVFVFGMVAATGLVTLVK